MRAMTIAVLVSGNGSNLQAIIDAISAGKLQATITTVISDKPAAYALKRAEQAGIKTHVVLPAHFNTRADYDLALQAILEQYQPKLIVLAGFMRILSPAFVGHYQNRIINIHPALLPKYPGLHTHEQVIANEDKYHGCSIHFVTADLDAGPIIATASLAVPQGANAATLKQKVQQLEHKLYPLVLQWFSEGHISLAGGQVLLDGQVQSATGCAVNLNDFC